MQGLLFLLALVFFANGANMPDTCVVVLIRDTSDQQWLIPVQANFNAENDASVITAAGVIGEKTQTAAALGNQEVMKDQKFWWWLCHTNGGLDHNNPRFRFHPYQWNNTYDLTYKRTCRTCTSDEFLLCPAAPGTADHWVCNGDLIPPSDDQIWLIADHNTKDGLGVDCKLDPGAPAADFNGQTYRIGATGVASNKKGFPHTPVAYLRSYSSQRPDYYFSVASDSLVGELGKTLPDPLSFQVIPHVKFARRLRFISDNRFILFNAFVAGGVCDSPGSAMDLGTQGTPISIKASLRTATDVNWFSVGYPKKGTTFTLNTGTFFGGSPPAWASSVTISAWTHTEKATTLNLITPPGYKPFTQAFSFSVSTTDEILIRVGPSTGGVLSLPYASKKRDTEETSQEESQDYNFDFYNDWCKLSVPIPWVTEEQQCNGVLYATCTASGRNWRECTCSPGYWAYGNGWDRNPNPLDLIPTLYQNVCNATYCDTVIRIPARANRYSDNLIGPEGDVETDPVYFSCVKIDYCAVYGPSVGGSVKACVNFGSNKKVTCAPGYRSVYGSGARQVSGTVVMTSDDCYPVSRS
jgi:hypothetical protein